MDAATNCTGSRSKPTSSVWICYPFTITSLLLGFPLALALPLEVSGPKGAPTVTSSLGLAMAHRPHHDRASAQPTSPSPFVPHYALYPKTYLAQRVSTPLQIDGDLTKLPWQSAPWSDPFDDIRGPTDSPPSSRPPATCQTRIKMLWDDDFLYIGAHITSHNRTVVATFTDRNSPIYQQDSDFEVFLDPPGCNHDYKELELNALDTVWNLLLDKPYDDGGSEHSGRVAKPGSPQYWDVMRQNTATKLLSGNVNDPAGAVWSVEMALAHSDSLSRYSPEKSSELKPRSGMGWRINFSRVEEKGVINWTWAPQVVWDAKARRYGGKVAMHLPDAWGYVIFVDAKDNVAAAAGGAEGGVGGRDPSWPARLAAMNVYYAQRVFRDVHERYAEDVAELCPYIDDDIVSPFQVDITTNRGDMLDSDEKSKRRMELGDQKSANVGFVATVYLAGKSSENLPEARVRITVTEDRLLSASFAP